MSLSSLLLFMSVYAVAVATPGPGVAALVARTLARGTAGAVPFILGFVVGDLTWFIAAAAGLSVIAKTYAPLFLVLKYAGCAYLLYIAIAIWRSEPQILGEGTSPASETPLAAFTGSLFLTLGNPKVMIFFLSIMPLVVDPEEMTWMTGLELGVVIAVLISSILFGYMLLASRARRLFRSREALGVIQKANAGVLAGAALLIARG
jgi:threonine/homoserine/homoserine lactone efflux protein